LAVTNIHGIKKGVCATIEYITNPAKTNDGVLVTSHLCVSEPHEASQQFADIRLGIGGGKASTKAQHIIQSFAPGEITPEKALLVGEELCARLLNDNYQYVLAVHNDHEHVHCHIVFNNVNSFSGNTFETEFNQGPIKDRKWAKLREISDEVCRDFGLSVIENPIGKGVSHYERDMQKEGKSWKEKLRNKLAKIIFKSEDFDDFLRRCEKKNIEVVYTPEKKVKLKFRLEGQQRFVRADTLGEDYLPENIVENIALIRQAEIAIAEHEAALAASKPVTPKGEPAVEQKSITQPVTTPIPPKSESVVSQPVPVPDKPKIEPVAEQKPIENPVITQTVTVPEIAPTEIAKQPETVVQAEPQKDLWASVRKMGNSATMIQEFESVGINSMGDFYSIYHNSDTEKKKLESQISTLKSKISTLKKLISNIKTYEKTKPVMDEYRSKSGLSKTLYKKRHSDEIEQFSSARAFIKANSEPFYIDGKTPNIDELEKTLITLNSDYKDLEKQRNELQAKRDAVFKYSRNIRSYHSQQTNMRQHELSKQRVQQKKMVFGWSKIKQVLSV